LKYKSNNINLNLYYQIPKEINNETLDNNVEIIYLQLYKDTFLIFMQAFEQLQGILNYYKTLKKIKCIFEILRYLLIVKLKSY